MAVITLLPNDRGTSKVRFIPVNCSMYIFSDFASYREILLSQKILWCHDKKIKFAISIFTSKLVSWVFHLLYLIAFAIYVRKMCICPCIHSGLPMQLISHFQELIEKLGKKELPKDDYPCMNDPSPTFHAKNQSAAISQPPVAHSMRSRRTPTWARPRNSDDGYSRCFVALLFVDP